MHDRGESKQLGIERETGLARLTEVHLEADSAVDDAEIDDAAETAEVRLITHSQDRPTLSALKQADVRWCDIQHVAVVDDVTAAESSYAKTPITNGGNGGLSDLVAEGMRGREA